MTEVVLNFCGSKFQIVFIDYNAANFGLYTASLVSLDEEMLEKANQVVEIKGLSDIV